MVWIGIDQEASSFQVAAVAVHLVPWEVEESCQVVVAVGIVVVDYGLVKVVHQCFEGWG